MTYGWQAAGPLVTLRFAPVSDAWCGLDRRVPLPLLQFGDRPYILHLVDHLAARGCTRVDFIVEREIDAFRKALGSGAKWGAEFGFQLGDLHSPLLWNAEFHVNLADPQDGALARMETPEHLLASQRRLLENGPVTGRRQARGVWLGRGAQAHSSVQLLPPVYLGENCRLMRGVRIGPNVVIGANCLIDRGSIVRDALVQPGTYVGQELEVNNAIVDREFLLDIGLGAGVQLSDEFLLGEARTAMRWGGGGRVRSSRSSDGNFSRLFNSFFRGDKRADLPACDSRSAR